MSMLSDEFDDILAGSSGNLGPRRLSSSSGGTFNESVDDFDPTSLLSEPLFDDDNGAALSLDLNEIPGLPPDPTVTESGSESSRSNKNQAQLNGMVGDGGTGRMQPQPVYNDLQSSTEQNQQQRQQMFQEQQMRGGGTQNNNFVNVMGTDQMNPMMGQQQQQQFNAGPMNNFQGMAMANQQMQNGQMQQMTGQMQMPSDHQQQQQSEYGYSFNDQSQQQNMGGMAPNSIQDQQQAVNQRMMEVQQKIQQVQQQIQHVQLNTGGSNAPNAMAENQNPQIMNGQQHQMHGQMPTGSQGMLQDSVQHAQQDQQGSFQGMPNNAMNSSRNKTMNAQGRMITSPSTSSRKSNNQGFHRSPPGRSVSMTSPTQRTSPFSNSFVMQQQQQHQNALKAMSQSLNTYQNQQQQNQRNGPTASIDASTRSVPGDMGSMQAAMMQQSTMQGTIGQPPFAGGGDDATGAAGGQQMMRNNSLPGQGPPMRNNSMGSSSMQGGQMAGGGLDLAAMAQSLQANAAANGEQPSNVNEAMEKLCESMRRSAMSRSLVKQLSGKTLQRSHSGRSLSRSNSGRMAPVRSNSGRQLSRANSGKSLQRSHSGRQSMLVPGTPTGAGGVTPGMDNSVGSMGSDMMSRRMSGMSMSQNSRNRLTPTRGVFRHHSTTAAMGNTRMSSLAAMQQAQMQQQQQMPQQMPQQMDPNSFQMMDPSMMQQQQQQFQQQQQQQQMQGQQHPPNMMDSDLMPGGGF